MTPWPWSTIAVACLTDSYPSTKQPPQKSLNTPALLTLKHKRTSFEGAPSARSLHDCWQKPQAEAMHCRAGLMDDLTTSAPARSGAMRA
jgi:hypothetical protein